MSEMIPAATLIPMRDRNGGPPEILMLRRHATLAFAADAWVFPGGRVDEDDRRIAAAMAADLPDAAQRIAAIREAIEEAGLALALDPAPDSDTVTTLRSGLGEGRPFGALIEAAGLALRPLELVAFARWSPPAHVRRSFDAHFYLARIDHDAAISVDGGECIDLCWVTAADMLARFDAGEAKMLFPTRANLARLAPCANFAEAAALAAATPVRLIRTQVDRIDGRARLSIPEGHGYPPITAFVERD